MDSYEWLRFLHIAAVVIAFGPTFGFPLLMGMARRRSVPEALFTMRFLERMNRMWVSVGALVVAVFGVGLIFEDATGYKDDFPAWLMWSIAWYVVMLGFAVTFMRTTGGRAVHVLEEAPADGPLPAEFRGLVRQIQFGGGLLLASTLGILLLMVWKP